MLPNKFPPISLFRIRFRSQASNTVQKDFTLTNKHHGTHQPVKPITQKVCFLGLFQAQNLLRGHNTHLVFLVWTLPL